MNATKEIIVRDLAIMNGKPIIKGTRITVELILKKLSEGATVEDLLKIYPQITAKQIMAVLDYAANVISNEEFRKIIYSELKYLCLYMQDLEKPLIKCLHSLITLDEQLTRENPPKLSIKQKIKDMMGPYGWNNPPAGFQVPPGI